MPVELALCTTVCPVVAFFLFRLASIKSGDVVVDPMCGGGSITIEVGMATQGLEAIIVSLFSPLSLSRSFSLSLSLFLSFLVLPSSSLSVPCPPFLLLSPLITGFSGMAIHLSFSWRPAQTSQPTNSGQSGEFAQRGGWKVRKLVLLSE